MMHELAIVRVGFAPSPVVSAGEVQALQATLKLAAAKLREFNAWSESNGREPDDTAQMFLCFAVAMSPDEKTRALALRCLERINPHAAAN